MGAYNRNDAYAYAQQWAGNYNPAYLQFSGDGGDCANFVSQCLLAGGIPEKTNGNDNNPYNNMRWFYNGMSSANAWKGSNSMRTWIYSAADTSYPRITFVSLGQSQINTLEKGDLLFKLGGTTAESRINRRATHVALVSRVVDSDIYVYQHSPTNGIEKRWASPWADTLWYHITGYKAYASDVPTCIGSGNGSGGDVPSSVNDPDTGGGSGSNVYANADFGTALYRYMVPNMHDNYIMNIQLRLNEIGHNCGSPDGYFGLNTDTAVRSLQSAGGIGVDGIVGAATRTELRRLI